ENHGLIEARNFRFEFDPHPCFTFTPLVQKVNPIPAKTVLIVPLLIKRTGFCTNFPPPRPDPNDPSFPPPGGDGGGGANCIARGRAVYEIPCEAITSGQVAPITFPNAGDCPRPVDYIYKPGKPCACPGGTGFTGTGSGSGSGRGAFEGYGGPGGRGHVGNLG